MSVDAHPFDQLLQFAVAVVRAAAAAGRDAGLADGRKAPPAVVLLVAEQAARRVLRKDQPQDLGAHLAQGDRVGGHLHAVLNERAAGQRIAPQTLDLDRAQAAAAERREFLVRAERGHRDAGDLGGAQDRRAFGDADRQVVDLEVQQAGVGTKEGLNRHAVPPTRSGSRRRRWRRSGRPRSTNGT